MDNLLQVNETQITNKIHFIRKEKVMLDRDLAELYGVETRVLNQSVKRNSSRFPEDFMFQLTDEEVNELVSQNVIPSKSYFGGRSPYAFTEQGVAMLSSVLKSETAIKVNIEIIRIFTKLRNFNFTSLEQLNKEILTLNGKFSQHEEKLELIFNFLHQLQQEKTQEEEFSNREKIGYKK